MAGRCFGNTRIQDFHTQAYNKEQKARLGWYQQRQQVGSKQSKQMEVFRKKIEAAAPKPTENLLALRDAKPKNYHKRKVTHDDYWEKLASATHEEEPMQDMYPVEQKVKDALYDGFTKEGKGRYQYLQRRYQHNPEEKFVFPVLNSMDHGWRFRTVIPKEDISKPEHGRTRIVHDTFYTKTGIPVLRKEISSHF